MKFTTILLVCTLAFTHVFASPLPMDGQRDRRPQTPDLKSTNKKLKVEGKLPVPKTNNPSGKLPVQGDKEKEYKPYHPQLGEIVTRKTPFTWTSKSGKAKSDLTSHPAVVISIEHPNGPAGAPEYHLLPMSSNLSKDDHPHQISNADFETLKPKPGKKGSIATQPVTLGEKDKMTQRLSSEGKIVIVPEEEMNRLRTAMATCDNKSCKCLTSKTGDKEKNLKHFISKLYYSVRIFLV